MIVMNKTRLPRNASPTFCKRCLYADSHPLGLIIDDEGICSGCRIHEEKDIIDWGSRLTQLKSLISDYKSRDGTDYDCIVPVSGAGDSYFIVDTVVNTLGLNPLLVNYNKFWNTSIGIWNLANLRRIFNCDLITHNQNIESVKKITRETLGSFGSVYWHCISGQSVYPVQVAVRMKIPLIIWGAHQGIEQVGMFSHLHEAEMTRRYRQDHDLMGVEAEDLLSSFNTIQARDIYEYRYPSDSSLDRVGVRGIYLSNYIRWDPLAQHHQMAKEFGYRGSLSTRTFDCYDYADCHNYLGIHDMLKLFKCGYSKVTDHATREIRHGRLSREEGIALVRHYEQSDPQGLRRFAEWIGSSQESLQWVCDTFRCNEFWVPSGYRSWEFTGLSSYLPDSTAVDVSAVQKRLFTDFSSIHEPSKEYITVGKGYP